MEEHTTRAEVRRVLGRFRLVDGTPRLSDSDWLLSCAELKGVDERDVIVSELAAVGMKFVRLGGEGAAFAVAQLFALASEVMASTALRSFARVGIDATSLERLGIPKTAKVPPVRGAVSHPNSLLSLLTQTQREESEP